MYRRSEDVNALAASHNNLYSPVLAYVQFMFSVTSIGMHNNDKN